MRSLLAFTLVFVALAKGPCPDYFGDISGLVSVVDPDVGTTEASASYCEGAGMPTPCTFIHYAGLTTQCESPSPPDGCHRYHKVTYKRCDALESLSLSSSIDTNGTFDAEGVLVACADQVLSNEVLLWGPPDDEPVSCERPSVTSDKHLIVGSPGVSFHQVANWVVVRALEHVGYTVDVVDDMPHRDLYPKFVAGEIDLVTGSDLPFNHAPWLWNHTDDFAVVGTVNEATDIVLGVPSYSGPTSVSELVSAKDEFTQEVLSLDTDTCPQCVVQGLAFADSLGFVLREVSPSEFQSEVKERMANNDKFVVSWYVPSYLQAKISGLVNLQGDVEPWSNHNAGKIIARHDSMDKLDDEARALLGALFVGNAAIQQMDVMVNDGKEPSAAADAWIQANQEMWHSFFGILQEPSMENTVMVV